MLLLTLDLGCERAAPSCRCSTLLTRVRRRARTPTHTLWRAELGVTTSVRLNDPGSVSSKSHYRLIDTKTQSEWKERAARFAPGRRRRRTPTVRWLPRACQLRSGRI